LCAHLAFEFEPAQSEPSGGSRARVAPLARPGTADLRLVEWADDGDDPLAGEV